MAGSCFHRCLRCSDWGDDGKRFCIPADATQAPSAGGIAEAQQLGKGKGKANEPGRQHMASKQPPTPAHALRKNVSCKHLQTSPFHCFVYSGEETRTRGLSHLILPFLQLERPIKVYKTTLLFGGATAWKFKFYRAE